MAGHSRLEENKMSLVPFTSKLPAPARLHKLTKSVRSRARQFRKKYGVPTFGIAAFLLVGMLALFARGFFNHPTPESTKSQWWQKVEATYGHTMSEQTMEEVNACSILVGISPQRVILTALHDPTVKLMVDRHKLGIEEQQRLARIDQVQGFFDRHPASLKELTIAHGAYCDYGARHDPALIGAIELIGPGSIMIPTSQSRLALH
jgi:hypothetical protein